MLEYLVGERTDLLGEGEKMVVICTRVCPGIGQTEEWLPGDELEDKTAEGPDISGMVDASVQNRLGSSKAQYSGGFCWWVGKEISYKRQRGISVRSSLRKRNRETDLDSYCLI